MIDPLVFSYSTYLGGGDGEIDTAYGIAVDAANNLLLVRGAIPGPTGGYVIVRPTNKL